MLSTQRFLSRRAASRVHGVGGSGKRATGKRPSGRRLHLERLEERTVLSGGVVTTSITWGDRAFASFLDADEKIVVAGDANGGRDLAVLRYAPAGTLDASFGQGGAVTTDVSRYWEVARAAVPYPDDRILVAGSGTWLVKGATETDFVLARYNSNGSLDATFGKGGIVRTDMGQNEMLNEVMVQDNGYIVAAGQTTPPVGQTGSREFVIARYTPAGTLDPGFAAGGILKTGIDPDGYAPTVTMHEGKILLVGAIHEAGDRYDYDVILARYDLDGSPDLGFGNAGKVISDLGSVNPSQNYMYERPADVAVDSSNRIIIAGYIGGGGREEFLVARYSANGSLDTSFGAGGFVFTNAYPSYDLNDAYELAIQPDGKIVAAGIAGHARFALARYNEDGSLDSTFGQDLLPSGGDGVRDGIVVTPILNSAMAHSLVIQSDGKIVASGYAYDGSRYFIALARYLPNGDLDPDFGPAVPTLSIADVNKYEGSGGWTTTFDFKVTLSSTSNVDVTVQYATLNGNATAGSDYQATSGTLTIPAGSMSGTITVLVNGDTTKEPDETFYVNLSNPGGVTITDEEGVGTIRNDDSGGKPPKGSSAQLSAADLFFLDLALNSQKENDKSDPLAMRSADELALMLVE